MSAATASSTDWIDVHVRIVDEAVDVWRPVKAQPVSEHVFRLSDEAAPTDERWSFAPGDAVVIERRRGPGGTEIKVAVARALDLDEPSSHWLRKAG
ncbi:hypothetical protein [Brevundimonas sp.]|jgi:hypothetical protein|uniref:hypothetical protein n=1 Tax=Brevundimonas sp. TaxID=1871086 RepID=UPI002603E183|nr:hypothetical protein [Brevundimonas sp.]